MDGYGLYAIVLLICGLIVLVFEVFTPSGGLLSVITTVVLVLSAVCAFSAWFEKAPVYWWTYVVLLVLLVPSTLCGTLYVLPRTAVGKQVLLEAPDLERVEPFVNETARLARLVGRQGVTQTLLNPGGMVLVEGERLHAFSEGVLLEPQTPVEVLEIRGTRVLVRAIEPGQTPIAQAQRPERIDFDVPAE
jgi:membrane-bound serine protease (ClpP class)